jgi:hypothetical protein
MAVVGDPSRACYSLKYRSQRLTAPGRLEYRADKIARRLGAKSRHYTLRKPKRMRWATFNRLRDEVRALDDGAFAYRSQGLLKATSWFSRAVPRL